MEANRQHPQDHEGPNDPGAGENESALEEKAHEIDYDVGRRREERREGERNDNCREE